MTNKSTLSLTFLSLLAISTSLTACVQDLPPFEREAAQRIAMPVFLLPRTINAAPFQLKAYERVHEKDSIANIYIEGDGFPFAANKLPLLGTTPSDPVGLRLATQDASANVIYLARPCQYEMALSSGSECPDSFKNEKRFAPEIIQAYNNALDNIKATNEITEFNIIGFGGGGAIATILAAGRDDIKTLRTVAAPLDHIAATKLHDKETNLTGSLNPVDFTEQLKDVPQHHFIGKIDYMIPPVVYNSYAQSMTDGKCLNVTLVENADNMHGWVEQWKALLALPVECTSPAEPQPVPFDPSVLDGDKGTRAK